MAPPESSVPDQPSFLLPPLLAALGIMACVFLALLALHFLVKRLRNPLTVAAPPQPIRQRLIDSLAVHAYDRGSRFLHPESLQRECCVCLSALEEGVSVRILPACRHVFHRRCIDGWLASRATCPFCRAEVSAGGSFVLPPRADEMEGSNNETAVAARDCPHRRSTSLISWPSDCRMMSFREKLGLKRCVSLSRVV